MTPIEFENVSGSHAKKQQSIKCNGKQLGDWLTEHGLELHDTSQTENASKFGQNLSLQQICSRDVDNECNHSTASTSGHQATGHQVQQIKSVDCQRLSVDATDKENCVLQGRDNEASQTSLQSNIAHTQTSHVYIMDQQSQEILSLRWILIRW